MAAINPLPLTLAQILEETGIPQDSLIFYQNNRWVYQAGQVTLPNIELQWQPIDSLGPFDIYPVNMTFILSPSTSKYTIIQIGDRHLNSEDQITGVFAPIAQITLEGFARTLANIPDDASHFCWLYPPDTFFHDDIEFDSSYESTLLKIGGFAYFNVDEYNGGTLEVTRVNSMIESATNGLTFEGPHP